MKHTSSSVYLWQEHAPVSERTAAHETMAPVISGAESAQLAAARSWPSSLQWVGILAFGQSLLFVAFWLWMCAMAGAATPETATWKAPELRTSDYQPATNRDPFTLKAVATAGNATSVTVAELPTLRLHGILYEAGNPSAMINDKLVMLNKPVTLATEHGEIQITATDISRERVIVNMAGKVVELRLGQPSVVNSGTGEQPSKP